MERIHAHELRKIYPNGTIGLDGLSLTIRPGEMVGVLGSSGAGKTTFFRLLNGTLHPTTGQLTVLGQPLHARVKPRDLHRLRARVAIINQHHNVIPPLSVLTKVLIGRIGHISTLRALSMFVRVPRIERDLATEALALVGLTDKIYSRADDLSGGQQQRVAIARAIVQHAELLLADEPIASVDMRNAALILDLFQRLNTELGVTVLMNLHQLDFAVRYCPRILAFKAGRLIYDGVPAGLNPAEIYEDGPLQNANIRSENMLSDAVLREKPDVGHMINGRDDHA